VCATVMRRKGVGCASDTECARSSVQELVHGNIIEKRKGKRNNRQIIKCMD
jgi:hypothetical protein